MYIHRWCLSRGGGTTIANSRVKRRLSEEKAVSPRRARRGKGAKKKYLRKKNGMLELNRMLSTD